MKNMEIKKTKNTVRKTKLLSKIIWARVTEENNKIIITLARKEGKYKGTIINDLVVDGLKYRGLK